MKRAAPLLVLLPVAAALLFTDLGGPWLWEDEADTALFARRIVAHGLPVAWDGRAFLDSDDGLRVAPSLLGVPFVMVGTPWLPYYATAASFAVFGESEWAARAPFALAGLATVALLYAWVLRTTGCVRAAFAAALLLLASTQFLLYARESRSYALNILLTLVVLWGFERLGRRRADPWLAVAAVLLFHVQLLPAIVALAACGALALLHPAERARLRPLLLRAPWVAALTLPWLWVAWSAAGANAAPLESALQLPRRLGQMAAEATVAIPLVGWAVGFALLRSRLRVGDRALLRICVAWLALAAALVPLALSESLLEVVGIRYVCALIPIACAITAVLIARASDGRRVRYAALLAVFAATHLAGNALPWLALGETRRLAGVSVRVPRELPDKLYNTTWWYFVRGLGVRDPGTTPALVELLRRDAPPGDVVLTNFGWDSLAFYTGLAQGMRISPAAGELRRAAIAQRLPSYLFAPDDADWLVWRGGNERFLGYPLTLLGWGLPRLRRELEQRGATLEPVATFPETLWENRPELFWHRFARVGQPFAPRELGSEGARYRDARAFRIRWPTGASVTQE